jgi:hypothetical protein
MKLNTIRRIILIVYAMGFAAVALFFVPRATVYRGFTPTQENRTRYRDDEAILGDRTYCSFHNKEQHDTVTDVGALAARLAAWTVICGVAFALGSRSPKTTEE